MTEFATALEGQLEARPDLTADHRRILQMLQAPDSPRKRRRLARMERRVRHELGMSESEAIDWSQIPWDKILSTVLQVLVALLPLLLAL